MLNQIFALLLVLFSCSICSGQFNDIDSIEASTVKLRFGNGCGSGVVIGYDDETGQTVIATARHVTQSVSASGRWITLGNRFEFRNDRINHGSGTVEYFQRAKSIRVNACRVVWRSPETDIAIVTATIRERPPTVVRVAVPDDPNSGRVVHAGFPACGGLSIMVGRKAGRGAGCLKASTTPRAGQSGGPVADDGGVVGVVSVVIGDKDLGQLGYVPFTREFLDEADRILKNEPTETRNGEK